MSREKHEITVYLHAETDKAVLVGPDPVSGHKDNAWLPKSQCDEMSRTTRRREGSEFIIGTEVVLAIPMWLIEKNRFEGLLA